MALDIVINFEQGEEVKGESTQTGFEEWLEATEYTEGAYNPKAAGGVGQTGGTATVHGVTFKTVAGKHTNSLKKAMLNNSPFGKVTIHFLKQIPSGLAAYDTRIFTNGYISNYDSKKTSDHDAFETWTMHATKVAWEYKPQDPNTHELGAVIAAEWDVAAKR